MIMAVLSQQTQAQQTSVVTSTTGNENQWKPAKIKDDGTNTLNGVEFYRKTVTTLIRSVIVLKVVNTNAYDVKIQWEESADVKKEIIIPANSAIEGSTDSTLKDSAESKLVFSNTLTKEEKQLLLSTMHVTPVN